MLRWIFCVANLKNKNCKINMESVGIRRMSMSSVNKKLKENQKVDFGVLEFIRLSKTHIYRNVQ